MTSEHDKKITVLERRIFRERDGRKAAEKLLEDKSRELYQLNQTLLNTNAELQKLTFAVEQSPTLVVITDMEGNIDYVNQSFCELTGFNKSEVLNNKFTSLKEADDPDELHDEIKTVVNNHQAWTGTLWIKRKEQTAFLASLTVSPLYDERGLVCEYLFNLEDITKQKQDEKKIHHLAHHDHLTGLYNRFSLEQRLSQTLYLARRSNTRVCVLFLDLDRFKLINDSLGHKAGDDILKQVAERLKGIFKRQSDIVARIGGDEFVIVLDDIKEASFAALTARAVVQILSMPYEHQHHQIQTSPSIGISIFPEDGDSAELLLKNADTAMFHIKKQGKNNFSFYKEEMNELIYEKIQLESELKKAIANDGFQLYYQPKIDTTNGLVYGVESLIRWQHPDMGFIPPDKFITVAEETGLIYELGLWVIEAAFRQVEKWDSESLHHLQVAINISARQLESERFLDDLEKCLDKYRVDPGSIELEITESTAMNNPDEAINKLKALRELGFNLAIDDFGTGYSSLAYLKMLPIQTLKLDRAFVNNLENDPNNAAICKASISLSHDLGLKVVAEGVETESQKNFLVENDCDFLQGYYFSPPKPAKEITEYIASINLVSTAES